MGRESEAKKFLQKKREKCETPHPDNTRQDAGAGKKNMKNDAAPVKISRGGLGRVLGLGKVRRKQPFVDKVFYFEEHAENDSVDTCRVLWVLEPLSGSVQRYLSCVHKGEPVDPCGDTAKGDCSDALPLHCLQHRLVRPDECLLTLLHGPHGVNNFFCRHFVAVCDSAFSGGAFADADTFFVEQGTCKTFCEVEKRRL